MLVVSTNKETDMQNWTPADLFKNSDGEWGQLEGDCYVTRTYKDGKLIKTTHHELGGIEKDADMHITDKLYQARRERDEAQARYEQTLAEHSEAYPRLAIEERKQPTGDMNDPANWQLWDWLECVCTTPDLTRGKAYQIVSVTTNHEPVIQDDDGAYVTRSPKCFRFYHRP